MSAEGLFSLGIGLLAGVSVIVIAPEWVKSAGESNPAAMILWTMTFFFAGAFIGSSVTKARAERTLANEKSVLKVAVDQRDGLRREIAELNAREDGLNAALRNEKKKNVELASRMDMRKARAEEEQQRVARRKWVLGLGSDEKILLSNLHDGEYRIIDSFLSKDGIRRFISASAPGLSKALLYTAINGHSDSYQWRVFLNETGKKAAEENLDLLNEAKEYAKKSKGSEQAE